LTGSQIIMTALFSWVLSYLFAEIDLRALYSTSFVMILLYCSIFATIVTIGLQTKYQKYVSAQKTALIFCLEPVFAAIFDILINNARLELYTIVGGGIILLSIVLLEVFNYKKVPENVYPS
jgi:drug/metabolite transporter (DMT)-like permease